MEHNYKHFKLTTDSSNILWLVVDRADQSVNSLSREVFSELDKIIEKIAKDSPKGVVITSGKAKGFIAGADISQFTHLENETEAYDLIRQAQIVLDKLESLPMPTVALINGFCLGGGLELALACRYRIALDEPGTRIGLPEIKLGIHPGWGGTVRLPKLIGPIEAMKMILPGAAYSANRCKKLGIVDAAVPERMMQRAAIGIINQQPPKKKPSAIAAFTNTKLMRPLLAKMFYKTLKDKKVNKVHYPAPYAVIKNWLKDGAISNNAMENEARSIAKLMLTGTARNLVRIFFLQEQMKRLTRISKFKPKHIHVIGAGTMGGDIAAWCAYKGFYVTLQDQSPEKIAPAIKRAYKLFSDKARKPRLVQAAMDRLIPDQNGYGVKQADVIIEAVFENLAVKQEIFQKLEAEAKPEAILATNTSSIPLEEITTVLKNPSRLVGIHFFNPVAKMPLVEIVKGVSTDEDTVNKAAAFVGKISRLPLPVASHPGFLVNRVLMPYLMEATELYEEGVSAAAIDKAAIAFGMPMGPITLADKVGLDVCLNVAENLTSHFGGKVPERLRSLVKEGRLGVKTGKGFFDYDSKGKRVKSNDANTGSAPSDLTDRLIMRMLNEAVACLSEGVVATNDLLDAGMIFGTGFAPFLGGPMQYAKNRGVSTVVGKLNELAKVHGNRFTPNSGWQSLTSSENNSHISGSECKTGTKVITESV